MNFKQVLTEYRQPVIAAFATIGIIILLSFLSEYFLTTNNFFKFHAQYFQPFRIKKTNI